MTCNASSSYSACRAAIDLISHSHVSPAGMEAGGGVAAYFPLHRGAGGSHYLFQRANFRVELVVGFHLPSASMNSSTLRPACFRMP